MDTKIIFRYIFLYCFILTTFFVSGVLVNIIQFILYVTVRNISKYLYRKINYYICYSYYCQMIFVAEWYSNADIYIYIDKDDLHKYFGKEHACIICNHTYEIDWLFIGTFSDKVHCAGNFKAYIKKIGQYIPALGWCLYLSDNIFLERTFEKDKEVIAKQITEIVNHPDPAWIILYPEGTRFSKKKHEQSSQFAKEKGLPQFKHHLTPKPKGFLTSLPAMRNKLGAIYDVTLSVNPNDNEKPTMFNTLLGKKVIAHFYIQRIPIEKIPRDEEGATKFLNDLFIKKDQLQESFFQTGNYFSKTNVPKYISFKLSRNILTLLNTIMWYTVTLVPISYYTIRAVVFASIYSKAIILGSIIIFFVILSKIITINNVKKDSNKSA